MTLPGTPTLLWMVAALMVAAALAFVLPGLVGRRGRSPVAAAPVEASTGMAERANPGRAAPYATHRPAPRLALAIAIALPLAALGLYAILGEPDAAGRTAKAPGREADDPAAVSPSRDGLVRHLARQPRDARGWMLLARMDLQADRFADAVSAYEKAIAASPKTAGDPAVWCELADALGMERGGRLAGRPRELVMHALTLDPAHPKALEMAGSAAYEAGDYEMAAGYWRQLLAQLPEATPVHRELATAVERVGGLARGAGAAKPAGGPGR